ncbi:MAG: serine/threonine protein kinase, partial [Acidobacteria bacterium]|nr:serine/threonine protein kinase [Acidobacteriota bacterium]
HLANIPHTQAQITLDLDKLAPTKSLARFMNDPRQQQFLVRRIKAFKTVYLDGSDEFVTGIMQLLPGLQLYQPPEQEITPVEVGTSIDQYVVEEELARGGMGVVYRVKDRETGKTFALKQMLGTDIDDDRLRFQREAQLGLSEHPNIVSLVNAVMAGPRPYIVMEYVKGKTLRDIMKKEGLGVREGLELLVKVVDGLQHAHSHGVVHRDVKPDNIMVTPGGQVKVLDFGLAKAFQPDASAPNMSASPTISLTAAATQMGVIMGTAAYMSPEQARGKATDGRADI